AVVPVQEWPKQLLDGEQGHPGLVELRGTEVTQHMRRQPSRPGRPVTLGGLGQRPTRRARRPCVWWQCAWSADIHEASRQDRKTVDIVAMLSIINAKCAIYELNAHILS